MAKKAYVFCERSLKQRQRELNRGVICVCIQHSNKLSVWAPSYWIFWKYAFLVMADVIDQIKVSMEEAIDFCANSRGSCLYHRNIYLNVPLVQNLSLTVYELQTLNFHF